MAVSPHPPALPVPVYMLGRVKAGLRGCLSVGVRMGEQTEDFRRAIAIAVFFGAATGEGSSIRKSFLTPAPTSSVGAAARYFRCCRTAAGGRQRLPYLFLFRVKNAVWRDLLLLISATHATQSGPFLWAVGLSVEEAEYGRQPVPTR